MLHAGGFAPFQLLPGALVIPLPPGTDPATAVLAQQLGMTIFGMKRFWPGPGEGTAVVLGAGTVGLGFTWLCRSAGVEHVVVSDLHRDRLEVATAMGATLAVIAAGDAVVDAVHELAPEGARLVIEAAGKDVTRVQAVHCVALDGRIGMFGMAEGAEMVWPFETLFRRKPTVEFRWDAQAEPGHPSFREVEELIRTGRFDPTPLLPRLFTLAELPEPSRRPGPPSRGT